VTAPRSGEAGNGSSFQKIPCTECDGYSRGDGSNWHKSHCSQYPRTPDAGRSPKPCFECGQDTTGIGMRGSSTVPWCGCDSALDNIKPLPRPSEARTHFSPRYEASVERPKEAEPRCDWCHGLDGKHLVTCPCHADAPDPKPVATLEAAVARTNDAFPDVVMIGANSLRELGRTRRTPHAPLFLEGAEVMGTVVRYVRDSEQRTDSPRDWEAEVRELARVLGIEYQPDTGSTYPGPLEAMVAQVRELQERSDAWLDLQARTEPAKSDELREAYKDGYSAGKHDAEEQRGESATLDPKAVRVILNEARAVIDQLVEVTSDLRLDVKSVIDLSRARDRARAIPWSAVESSSGGEP